MDYLHPVMAAALKPFAPQKVDAMEEYKTALRQFDWQYQFADDYRQYMSGLDALQHLHRMQLKVDPDGVVWMQLRPDVHGAPMPIVRSLITEVLS